MSRLLAIFCCCLIPSLMKGQSTPFGREELRTVKSFVRNPLLRVPLPYLMRSDMDCMNFSTHLLGQSEQELLQVADSAMARKKENDFILERIDYAVSPAKAEKIKEQIHREELRLEAFEYNYKRFKAIKEAERREMPKGELVYIRYSISGMVYYPLMPANIRKVDENKALVTYAEGYYEKSFETDVSFLSELREYIKDKKLYKLYSTYDNHSFDNLPDLGGPWMKLDGMTWDFTAKFSDGTVIDVGGNNPSGADLSTLQLMIENLINKHLER